MSRTTAREAAFKTIFEIPFHVCETAPDVINYISNYDDGTYIESVNDKEYFLFVTTACFENLEIIDNKTENNLKSWTIDRISKVDLAILRLALSEILFYDDIPYQVSINEAVELAKKYSDDAAPAFINGMLASIVNEIK